MIHMWKNEELLVTRLYTNIKLFSHVLASNISERPILSLDFNLIQQYKNIYMLSPFKSTLTPKGKAMWLPHNFSFSFLSFVRKIEKETHERSGCCSICLLMNQL